MLQVQEEMLKVHWREDVLLLPHCQAQVGRNQDLVFVGPRVKMGIYEGVPTRVAPHTTTGSADYFGPLVNRSVHSLHSKTGTHAFVASPKAAESRQGACQNSCIKIKSSVRLTGEHFHWQHQLGACCVWHTSKRTAPHPGLLS